MNSRDMCYQNLVLCLHKAREAIKLEYAKNLTTMNLE
jgi:hypothetical protein